MAIERSLPAPLLPRRVAITGVSVACALGVDLDPFWNGLLDGRPAISHLEEAAEHGLPVQIGGRVDDDELAAGMARYGLKDPDRSNKIALYVAGAALDHAGLATDGAAPLAMDSIVGTGHGNVAMTNDGTRTFDAKGHRRVRPTSVLRAMFNRPASLVSIQYGLTGASHVVSAACASTSVALGEAFTRIRFGLSDGAVVACCDTGFDIASFAAWTRLGVLSTIPDPTTASRPFDAARKGIVMAEGGAALVLEEWDAAERRGATILAELAGYGCSSDAHHIVRPLASGQVRAVEEALASAGITAADIDYVNAHGTGTDLADVVECESLGEVLGDRAAQVPVSTTKGQLGHFMGATAGVELVATVLSLRAGVIPPCRNLDDPDPRCTLAFVRGDPLTQPIRYALKSTFAFGGTNSAVLLARPD